MSSQILSRRDFLKITGIGGAALLFPNRINPIRVRFTKRAPSDSFVPDAIISLTATDKKMQILSGMQTRVYSYEGQLIGGSGGDIQAVPDSYLGPILRLKSGTKLRILFRNNLIENSVLHPHGLRVPEDCDGQPMQAIGPGQTKIDEFEVIDRAGPRWFHPHPMGRTAEQVMMGLAGLFYVWDDEDRQSLAPAREPMTSRLSSRIEVLMRTIKSCTSQTCCGDF